MTRTPDGEAPDADLVARFLAGDEAAFRALYGRHAPRLRMIVARLLGSRTHDVDDVVQEAWLGACRGLAGFRGDAQFGSWLTTIGIRAAYARFGPEGSEEVELLDDVAAAPLEAPASAIDLERALAMLPGRDRAVVVLHDVEGFTHQEIAERLGGAPGTSKATLFRARRALRRLLNGGAPYVQG